MNRDDRKVFLHAGLIALFVILSAAIAHAADAPCPPKRYYCWEVKLAVSTFGEQATIAKARQCGWPSWKIEEAKRCLK
jgi:hypothetical protein